MGIKRVSFVSANHSDFVSSQCQDIHNILSFEEVVN